MLKTLKKFPTFGLFLLVALAGQGLAEGSADEGPVSAGADTRGGLASEPTIIEVTSLEDSGPGTLREAVVKSGPRVVVFKVAGVIELESVLRISKPFITIAGQTAPSPGITLAGEKLRITSHDVVIQHLSVRPHWAEIPDNADAISIGECNECEAPSGNILLENLSVSWGVDENIGIWGEGLTKLTVRNSLIAEALLNAGHEKGAHSMGLLVGDDIHGVEIAGNIFASNNRRNPVIQGGVSAYIANNYIYNPGRHAIHAYRGQNKRATLIGNLVQYGPDTHRDLRWFVSQDFFEPSALYSDDNHCCDGAAVGAGDPPRLNRGPLPVISGWTVMPASEVADYTLRFAGSRPLDRNPVDERIIGYIKAREGRIIDDPQEVGGYLAAPTGQEAPPALPDRPYDRAGTLGQSRLEAWLCLLHLKAGGPLTPSCGQPAERLREALNWSIH